MVYFEIGILETKKNTYFHPFEINFLHFRTDK